ncbi:hypothetical protein TNIN_233061 [Trichonephila inaurata madagascariensis]|uniref:Uncharacterized protein n=1 Tax=Trichonephila inaurata madagascariensis TaxID=2747483 RepID=A0A8X7BYU5_9ARAC|nr:hypothetical protein TNIN_233061 [Trichonephila inaurata madagascariensis]
MRLRGRDFAASATHSTVFPPLSSSHSGSSLPQTHGDSSDYPPFLFSFFPSNTIPSTPAFEENTTQKSDPQRFCFFPYLRLPEPKNKELCGN